MSSRFEIHRSRIGRRRWRVRTIGDNNQILQTSEHLNSRDACITNIAAVSAVVHDGAEIVDTTQ